MPYTSRFSTNLSVDQQFPLTSRVTGFVGASLSYVGDRQDVFTGTAQRANLPAYAKTDLRSGVTYDSWTLDLYVNNVTDRRGLLSGGVGNSLPFALNYIQPRTIGLDFNIKH